MGMTLQPRFRRARDYEQLSFVLRVAHRVLLYLVVLIGTTVLTVTLTPVLSWWLSWLMGPWGQPSGSILVVLTAENANSDGSMGYSSYWRAMSAMQAWRAGSFQTVIISGAGAAGENIADYMQFHGVPVEAIVRENRSLSTRENAVYTAAILRGQSERSVVLLTSDFHMRRAAACFRKVGLTILPRPIPDAGKRYQQLSYKWWVFLDLLGETIKYCGYRAKAWA
jgi:uncharacterized SAM-binding protein YcdF (DUF218 family)